MLALPASAADKALRPEGGNFANLQKTWVEWAFGSNTNPFQTGVCGEKVGKNFLLTAASKPGDEAKCDVPADTPMLVAPAGAISWAPTFGKTAEKLLTDRNKTLKGLKDPEVTIDGKRIAGVDRSFHKTGVYRIDIGRKSLLGNVAPEAGRDTRVASAGWHLAIDPLTEGKHKLVLSVEGRAASDITITLNVGD